MRSVGALGGVAGAGSGKVEELAVEIVAVCGLQAPQASFSESSTAMVEAAAWTDEAHGIPLWAACRLLGPSRRIGRERPNTKALIPQCCLDWSQRSAQPLQKWFACFAQGLVCPGQFLCLSPLLRLARLVAVRSPGTGIGGGGADTRPSRPAVQNSGELSTSDPEN